MTPIQITPIKKEIIVQFTGDKVVLPSDIQQKIETHWKALVAKIPQLKRGPVFTVISVEDNDEVLFIKLAETDYAHYLYSHYVGDLDDLNVKIIHPVGMVISSDNKIIFGAMGAHTSRPGIMQFSGGGIDHGDLDEHGVVDLEHSVAHELQEELGIDIYDSELVQTFEPAYLKFGGAADKRTVIYRVKLTISAAQFMEAYRAFADDLRDRGEHPEFDTIHVVPADRKGVEAFLAANDPDMLEEHLAIALRKESATL